MSDNYTFDIKNFCDNQDEILSLKNELAVANKKIDELRHQKNNLWKTIAARNATITRQKAKYSKFSTSRSGMARNLIKNGVKDESLIAKCLFLSIKTVRKLKNRMK